jgi:hypothetical protein
LPVGNADKGVGLWAGQIMFTIDNVNQYIDWWHEVLPGSGEDFDHEGTLSSVVFSPGLTIGVSNYWNMSISQVVGVRYMTWDGDTATIHHRNEGSHSDFINAIGGLFGDTRILFRYLLYNDGQGEGKRLFLGGGLVVPSKNTITSDPFFLKNPERADDHRHFSMSDGAYKAVLETQYFKKRNSNPVFLGGALTTEIPLNTNEHGYRASRLYDLSLSVLTKEVSKLNAAISSSIVFRHSTKAYWNDMPSPNSRSTVLTAGIGLIWNLGIGGLSVNLQRPFFLDGRFSGIEGEVEQRVSAYQLSLSYRRVFDYIIPWLDPLRDL